MPVRSHRIGRGRGADRPYAPIFTEAGWGGAQVDDELDTDESAAAAAAASAATPPTTTSPPFVVPASPTAPITTTQAQSSQAKLTKMRGSLTKWLKYRAMNDQLASGTALPTPVLKRPGAKRTPPAQYQQHLAQARTADETKLASDLYQLLSEVFDPSTLPEPDLTKNPAAAVQLAQIAIAGKVPSDTQTPQAGVGFVWLWPLVIVAGIIAIVIITSVQTSADAAAERERLDCIQQGACTDSGFWIKVGALAFIGWLAWDKFGLKKHITGKRR